MAWVPDKVSAEARADGVGTRFKLRESGDSFAVVALVDDQEVFRDESYYHAAKYLHDTYGLSEESTLALSRDYKDSVENEDYA